MVEIVFHLIVLWQTQQITVLHIHQITRLKKYKAIVVNIAYSVRCLESRYEVRYFVGQIVMIVKIYDTVHVCDDNDDWCFYFFTSFQSYQKYVKI